MSRIKMKIIVVWLFSLSILILPTPTRADGVVGDGTPESCTFQALRDAAKDGGTITFNCGISPLTIKIKKTLILKKNTTIDGGGLITLSGNSKKRIIINRKKLIIRNITLRDGKALALRTLDGGAAIQNDYRANLTVENVQFINNRLSAPNRLGGGAAIRIHSGTLIVRNSIFEGNRVTGGYGAAIYVLLSNAEITDSTFTSNKASAQGNTGGIFVDGTLEGGVNGYIRLLRNKFIGNGGQGEGGAVYIWQYTTQPGTSATIAESVFTGNKVTKNGRGWAFGGAVRIGNGPVTIRNVVFNDNRAAAQGGALYMGELGSVTLINVTVSGNKSVGTNSGEGLGGGITLTSDGNYLIRNSTISDNYASSIGGGMFGGGGNVRLQNTIVSKNKVGNSWNISQNCARSYVNGGGNIQYPAATGSSANPNCANGILFKDPLLLPLTDYGDGMLMHAIAPRSPAINHGMNDNCIGADGRGVARPQGDRCDSGAFELEGVAPVIFTMLYPVNNAVVAELQPTLRWTVASGAEKYQLLITSGRKTVIKKNLSAEADCGVDCSFALPKSLKDGKKYKVTIKALNMFGVKKVKTKFKVDLP